MSTVTASRHRCVGCALGSFCLPLGLRPDELAKLDAIMRVGRLMGAEESLYHVTDPVRAIYAVRSGCYKSSGVDCDGKEQVLRFHLPGELIGLDGLFSGVHRWNVRALSQARVCIFPLPLLMGLSSRIANLQERLLRLVSKDVVDDMAAIGDYPAEERTAAFIRSLSLRVAPRGQPSECFDLPMRKADMANYLRLAQATLSRTLNLLRKRGAIGLKGRRVTVLNARELNAIARHIPQPYL